MPPRTPFFLTSPIVWGSFVAGSLGFAADIASFRHRSDAGSTLAHEQQHIFANKAANEPPAMEQFAEKKTPEVEREEPTQAAADAGYRQYVEGWKREEGLPEEAVRQVVASQHRGAAEAATQAEAALGTAEGGRPQGPVTETVPLSELTDFMMERSRK